MKDFRFNNNNKLVVMVIRHSTVWARQEQFLLKTVPLDKLYNGMSHDESFIFGELVLVVSI